MEIKMIDARGLSCHQPVLLVQKAIEEGQKSFEVIVNSGVAKENILRLLKKHGLKWSCVEEGTDTYIHVTGKS